VSGRRRLKMATLQPFCLFAISRIKTKSLVYTLSRSHTTPCNLRAIIIADARRVFELDEHIVPTPITRQSCIVSVRETPRLRNKQTQLFLILLTFVTFTDNRWKTTSDLASKNNRNILRLNTSYTTH